MSDQVDSGDTAGVVSLVLQYIVLPVIGFVVWGVRKIMQHDAWMKAADEREEQREKREEDRHKHIDKQHDEVMAALNSHNESVSRRLESNEGRLQSIEEHLRGGHNAR